jgi:hypothetical protein
VLIDIRWLVFLLHRRQKSASRFDSEQIAIAA